MAQNTNIKAVIKEGKGMVWSRMLKKSAAPLHVEKTLATEKTV